MLNISIAHGLSGSWVIREGKLCGIIYAAYTLSPYLHMFSAEKMFQDIAEVLQTSIPRVANPREIEEYARTLAFQKMTDEGTLAFQKTTDEGTIYLI
jgi:hypothetical protein